MSINLKNSNKNIINQTLKYSDSLDDLIVNFDFFEMVVNIIYENLPEQQLPDTTKQKLDRNLKRKNKLNRLSTATYENIIKENVDEYYEIKNFISKEENRNIKRKYLAIKQSLYPNVISAIDSGKTMDEVLSSLNAQFSIFFNKKDSSIQSDESYVNCSGFFYYMYYICDIGKE